MCTFMFACSCLHVVDDDDDDDGCDGDEDEDELVRFVLAMTASALAVGRDSN